ncbi:TonB-dependent receptor plug domain-containing protein [Chryseobacterium sp. TY4]
MRRKLMPIVVLGLSIAGNAQKTDSIQTKKIDEVVVMTAQYKAQTIDKSIYKVELINETQIRAMAASNVSEVLNQSLNMLVLSDSKSGNSTANILGLGGDYVKVLIDNIPVVGDTGLGSNIDLTKLSVNNIERIEIVKGSMGVEYGNGAMSGVINIITKKSTSKTLSGRLSIQEETVRDNYDIRKKGNGRHIQNLNLNYNIDNHWFVSVSVNHNQFMGFRGNRQGYKYFEQDNLRGYDWNPKDQYDANAILKYQNKNTNIFYKASFLREKFNYYNPLVSRESLNDGLGGVTYTTIDRDFNTKRWIHQLNVQSQFGHVKFDADVSYQSQNREYQDKLYDIPNREVKSTEASKSYFKTDIFYSRAILSNFLNSKLFDFQLGYELDHTAGYAALIAGDFFGDNVSRKIFTYANFLSSEWNVSDRFSIRPGLRLTVSNQFKNQFNYSLSAKLKTSENSYLRAVFGSANKLPTYDELFTYFVNTNHDLQGNPDLDPEVGYSIGAFWDQSFKTQNDWRINYGVNFLYLDLNDKIEMVMVKEPSTYKFLNINNFRSILYSGNFDVKKDQFLFGFKASVNAIKRGLEQADLTAPDDYNYQLQLGASATYKFEKLGTSISAFYKYNGKEQRYVYRNSQYELGEIGAFSMLDFMVNQTFWKNRLEISAGVKNLFDVTSIKNTTTAASGHNESSGSLNLFYGRSYFARLSYQF